MPQQKSPLRLRLRLRLRSKHSAVRYSPAVMRETQAPNAGIRVAMLAAFFCAQRVERAGPSANQSTVVRQHHDVTDVDADFVGSLRLGVKRDAPQVHRWHGGEGFED